MSASIWHPADPAPVGVPISHERALSEIDEMIQAGERSPIVLNERAQERMAELRRIRDEL